MVWFKTPDTSNFCLLGNCLFSVFFLSLCLLIQIYSFICLVWPFLLHFLLLFSQYPVLFSCSSSMPIFLFFFSSSTILCIICSQCDLWHNCHKASLYYLWPDMYYGKVPFISTFTIYSTVRFIGRRMMLLGCHIGEVWRWFVQ